MTLRVRLLAAFAYVLLLAIVALEVPLALNLSRRVDAEIKSEASSGAQLVADSAAGRLHRERELQGLLRTAARDLGGRVIVTDDGGRLVADSAGTGLRRSDYGSRPEIAAALAGRTAQGTRYSDSLGEDLLFTAVPLVRDGRAVGAVRVTQSVAAVQAEVRNDIVALDRHRRSGARAGPRGRLDPGRLDRPARCAGSRAPRAGSPPAIWTSARRRRDPRSSRRWPGRSTT